jgi:rubrerythrin
MNAAMQAVGATIEYERPRNLAEFMSLALAMESEAAQRYAELADTMETANNVEVAELFRKMANIETGHARAIMNKMRWREYAPPRRASPFGASDGPETPGDETVHYLMQPYHALELALECEERAEQFYAELALSAEDADVREAARTLEAEEREHCALVREWLERVDKPAANWADDPDPPRYTD